MSNGNGDDASTTMILRFRDLSVGVGETIGRHREIIGQSESVWWGWWKKQGEKIPVAEFQRFAFEAVNKGGLQVLLFDSGTLSLFKARLLDIQWDAKGDSIQTPKAELTPSYYGTTKYLAWFKLGSIEPVADVALELKQWSYVKVEDFFEESRSVFSDFYGKQIASPVELKHQERTIWFIRKRVAGDRTHEIHVYDSSRISPEDFPTNPISSKSNIFLWLSDLHFSHDHYRFPTVSTPFQTDLSTTLLNDLEEFCGAKEVAGVLITGDVTWKASREEFGLARDFIDRVRSWSTLQYNSFVVCPGNHDLAFVDDPWTKGASPTVAPEDAIREFQSFYESIYFTRGNKWLCSGRRFFVGNARAIDVISLNSSILKQTKGAFQGQGFVGEEQLAHAARQMNWRRNESAPRAFRIVMLHHHVVPVINRELPAYEQQSSVVYDAGALCKWLVEHEVDLVLHGHMHQPMMVKESRSRDLRARPVVWHEFLIASLGSTGVVTAHTMDNRNSYGVLKFERNSVKLTVRQISPSGDVAQGEKTISAVELPYRF